MTVSKVGKSALVATELVKAMLNRRRPTCAVAYIARDAESVLSVYSLVAQRLTILGVEFQSDLSDPLDAKVSIGEKTLSIFVPDPDGLRELTIERNRKQ